MYTLFYRLLLKAYTFYIAVFLNPFEKNLQDIKNLKQLFLDNRESTPTA